jgi:putative phosphoserine phosphatase/1-acylglycerol-3-phosphate O-acyltransferase
VWPRSSRLPKLLNVLERPKVTASVGEPVELKRKSLDADTKRIMKAIVNQLPPQARLPHDPTPEELAATYPPGYHGDPDRESTRRPGTD